MNIILPKKAKNLLTFFKKNKFECYLVGGYVRDYLINPKTTTTESLDFTTNAKPDEILKLFPLAKYENKFGTVILSLAKNADILNLKKNDFSEKDIFEITTYRSEEKYSDSRHPDKVVWGETILNDLKRRDFTINALATNENEIIDLFDGQKDLKNKIIRAIGNPTDRFNEDALRMLRAIRFSATLDFEIEEKTLFAISENYKKLSFISWERIRDEFLKILSSKNPKKGIELLQTTNLLKIFLPELYESFGVSQVSPLRHHIYDVGTHLLNTLNACENNDPILRLACLIHDIGKPKTKKILSTGVITFYNHEVIGTEMAYIIGQRLRLSNKDLIKLTKLIRFHQFLANEELTDNAIRRFIREVGLELVPLMIDLRTADRIGSGSKPSSWRLELFKKRLVEVQKEPFTVRNLKINGLDVMKFFKLTPGPRVGEILDQVFSEVVNNKLQNERKILLNYLKKINDK